MNFLQNSYLVKLYTSASDCKDVGNISWKPICESLFSSFVAFFMIVSQKNLQFNADFSWVKNRLELGQEYGGCSSVFTLFFANVLNQNRPVCWSIVKERANSASPSLGAFPSHRIAKTTKDVDVQVFIHSSGSCKLWLRIVGTVWCYYVLL